MDQKQVIYIYIRALRDRVTIRSKIVEDYGKRFGIIRVRRPRWSSDRRKYDHIGYEYE